MSYNYPQPQYQPQQYTGYSGYKPAPQYPQWPQATPQLPQVRPVSSIEEVRACPIDFDGSVFYFADVANKRIYTKQINLDGTASINLYELKAIPTADQNMDATYITRQEFDTVINQLKDMYSKLIAPIEGRVEESQTAAQPKSTFTF